MSSLASAILRAVAKRVPCRSAIPSLPILSSTSNTNDGDGFRTNPSSTLGKRIGQFANVSESSTVTSVGIRVLMLAVRS